jgi:hypothetical protein
MKKMKKMIFKKDVEDVDVAHLDVTWRVCKK